MNEMEGFSIYYSQEMDEGKNQSYWEEAKEKDYIEEKENNVIINEEKETKKKITIKDSTSKRLSSLPKTYKTYDLGYKKKIIKEVNKYIY
jgi:hypothetical protein